MFISVRNLSISAKDIELGILITKLHTHNILIILEFFIFFLENLFSYKKDMSKTVVFRASFALIILCITG